MAFALPALLAGCGAIQPAAHPANATFSISPGVAQIDTSCNGCNAVGANGSLALQFSARLDTGGAAPVLWKVTGGDPSSGAGSISSSGLYSPPSYLTADSVRVVVTATLKGSGANAGLEASAELTLTPGFLQPLTPENAALGPRGTLLATAYLAEAGGTREVSFALASTPTGSNGGQGALSNSTCQHASDAFTRCTVSYTAPATLAANTTTWLVARAGNSVASAQILLNPVGVASSPVAHEKVQTTPILLGSSGGNNRDYDLSGGQIVDCCSGTLGALVQDTAGRQYILGNNHVLANSDHAAIGDAITQPGLIDNNCTPYSEGGNATPVALLSGWLPLKLRQTNVDAAIAQVNPGAVNPAGAILELGALQAGGQLAAAPPGTSSTGGRGENATLRMLVAKSGRTTGLTCGAVSAVAVDVEVAYFADCAESKPYLTKLFTNQIALSGSQFSDSGDSGALVVDAANAEPVGLFFAGGVDANGMGQAVANPAPEVLSELGAQLGAGGSFSFVGGSDHAVSCLHYGNVANSAASGELSTSTLAQAIAVKQQIARTLFRHTPAFFAIGVGQSSENPAEAVLVIYVDRRNVPARLPTTLGGLHTRYILMDRFHVTRSYATTVHAPRHCMALKTAPRLQLLAPELQLPAPELQLLAPSSQLPAF